MEGTQTNISELIRIGGATVNQTPFDWQNNTQHIIDSINEARQQGVSILCLPELCITGYGCEDQFLSEWLSEKAWEELEKIKSVCVKITVAVGLPVRIDSTTYNGACVISNQKILGITLKQNLAKDGVHYEPRWFEEWEPEKIITIERNGSVIEVGDLIYEVNGIRFGFEICEDAWRKKRAGLNVVKRGIHLMLNPSASHFALGKSISREALVTESSSLFNCTYVYANLLGNEAGRIIYDGDIIIAQQGKTLALNKRLSFQSFNLVTCEVDFYNAQNSKATLVNDNKDRNEELTRAITLALYDYLRKSKAKGFVVSLSGGADSSICSVLVAEMIKRSVTEIGWDVFCQSVGLNAEDIKGNLSAATHKILTCAYQATKNSSEDTFRAAQELANSLGAEFHQWKIDDEVNSYTAKIETAIGRKLSWQTDDITLQNIQARSRSPIIWMLANIKQSVLITTSNRSEGDVGYATMDGDTSGSLAPIAGIDKPTILQWLRWAESTLGYTGLKKVNGLQPTAELRPTGNHQTDETDLMPYITMVEIEKHAILERKSPVQVFKKLEGSYPDKNQLKLYIRKFFKMWAANQWKRERLAPSFHLDDLNVDPRTWCRFPILSSGFIEELSVLETL